MPSLLDLPAELLDWILEPCEPLTLSRLSRTNVGLHRVITPRLYNSIDWFWEDDEPSPPLHLLLRTLINNPSMRALVKYLRLRGGGIVPRSEWKDAWFRKTKLEYHPVQDTRSIWTEGRFASFSFGDYQKVQALISTLVLPLRPVWMSEFERGSVDAMLALLLHHTPALRQFDLGFGYLQQSYFVPAMLRHHILSSKSSSHFLSLTNVILAADVPKSAVGFWSDLDLLRPLFFLPAVESITTVVREPVIFTWPGKAPQLFNLSTLVLNKCSAPERTLEKILSCTPALKHLTYSHCRTVARDAPDYEYPVDPSEFESTNIIQCGRLDAALSHVQDTLETLVFTISYEDWPGVHVNSTRSLSTCGVTGRMGSIKTMSKLTSLEIPWVLLFGWEPEDPPCWTEFLPPTIQCLRIRDDMRQLSNYAWAGDSTVSRVEQLLDVRPQAFVALNSICFTYIWVHWVTERSSEGWYDEHFLELRALCESEGLACGLRYENDASM
ncbi:hypothetical protein P154DRAFT_516487 [Amniculicola lignicola CBS 123094]|uniref:F-box domain-containing protein n=1 Tax=Amniculicola lignicola CBS 123094 TaxID=1392246 RepID=A0A6A5X451_9PLEO|nr:hypothetical protein P154DRAFT_516487 [Amniculicola lignicola CBS 123094]